MDVLQKDMISVIIPTYKRSRYLERAVSSVLCQSYKNIEIIIIDDNGNNKNRSDTEELIKRLYGNDPRIKYVQNERNMGGARARNHGAQMATGSYLCFLDDDDIFLEDKLENQHRFMKENKLEMSFSDIKMYNEVGKVVDVRRHGEYVADTDNNNLLVQHLLHHLTPTDTYMFTREGFEKSGGFVHKIFGDEYILMLNAILNGVKIGYYPRITAVQYLHSGTRLSSVKRRVAGDVQLLKIKKEYFDRLSWRQRRYVYFRHMTVLAVYFLRNRELLKFAGYAVGGFFSSPVDFVCEGLKMAKRVLRENKRETPKIEESSKSVQSIR